MAFHFFIFPRQLVTATCPGSRQFNVSSRAVSSNNPRNKDSAHHGDAESGGPTISAVDRDGQCYVAGYNGADIKLCGRQSVWGPRRS